jgi:hypothetical protein
MNKPVRYEETSRGTLKVTFAVPHRLMRLPFIIPAGSGVAVNGVTYYVPSHVVVPHDVERMTVETVAYRGFALAWRRVWWRLLRLFD